MHNPLGAILNDDTIPKLRVQIVAGAADRLTPLSDPACWADVSDPVRAMLHFDYIGYLADDILVKVDRASMDHGLEVRVPLLDHRIVEFLFSLPPSLTNRKRVLRKTLTGWGAPDPPRRKRGFEIPLAAWLRGPLRGSVARVLDSPAVEGLGLDRQVLQAMWDGHQHERADHSERLLAVAVLVRWTEEWT